MIPLLLVHDPTHVTAAAVTPILIILRGLQLLEKLDRFLPSGIVRKQLRLIL